MGSPPTEPTEALNTDGPWGMKNRDFRPLSRYISETVQDTDIVTMERS